MPEPYVDHRNTPGGISILIENPGPVQTRSNGSRYVQATISVQQARNLIQGIQDRIDWADPVPADRRGQDQGTGLRATIQTLQGLTEDGEPDLLARLQASLTRARKK